MKFGDHGHRLLHLDERIHSVADYVVGEEFCRFLRKDLNNLHSA